MDLPINSVLEKYTTPYRFHTPGHNGAAVLPCGALPFDITELSFSDNLANESGIILESQSLAAKALGVQRTLYYTIGATAAIQTCLYMFKDDGVLIVGEFHKSVSAAIELFSVKSKRVSFNELENVTDGYKAIFVTRPTYFGYLCDIEKLSEYAHNHEMYLIVDESWGSHFAFSSLLPESAVKYADMVINSYHKTTLCPTGGAALQVNSDALIDRAIQVRSMIHTTSPNYIILAGIEYAIMSLVTHGERIYHDIYNAIRSVQLPYPFCDFKHCDDFTAIKLESKESEIDMEIVAGELEARGIYAEHSEHDFILFLLTPVNYGYIPKIVEALRNINIEATKKSNIKSAHLNSLIGKLAECDIGLYPPGVPLVCKGEIITKEVVQILKKNEQRIFGIKREKND